MTSSPRALGYLLACSSAALALVAFAPRTARAQTATDADRAAARELFVAGVKLQEAGNFADALDRFDRAQAVFSAPTHLLHIAECEAALGKLVESAETYRTLTRTPLPTGSPPAFVQAQQQGTAELPQVEPRIPSIRLFVRPANLQNLQILVDGQPMSSALVGVQRPTDPGTHVVSVAAPGYMRSEQRVILHERENKDVTANLPVASGVTYTPPPPVVAPTANPPGPPGPPGPPPPPPPAPPMYATATETPPTREVRGGFMLGLTVGALLPGANLVQGQPVSNVASSGAAIGIDGGFRFVKKLYLGLAYEHGFLGSGNAISNGITSASASSDYIGLDFVFLSNPDGLAFYGDIGAGYRALSTSTTDVNGNVTSITYSGGEGTLGVGIHFKLGDWVRLIPRVSVSAGQFSSASNGSIVSGDTHSFVLIGVTGFVDFARKH
jgi:hypothetical protein